TVRQLELLRDLQRLANERAQEEERIRAALSEGLNEATAARDKAAREVEQQNSEHRDLATAEFEKNTADTRRQYEQQRDAAQHEYKGLRQGVESEHSRVTEAALAEQQQASWETQAVFEAIQGRPKERFLATVKHLERSSRELAVLEHDVTTVMKLRHQWREFRPLEDGEASATGADAPAGNKKAHRVQLGRMPEINAIPSRGWATGGDPVELAVARVNELTGTVRSAAETLVNQKLPRLFEGGNPFGAFALVWLVAIILSGIVFGWHGWNWLAASLVLAGLVYGGLAAWLWPKARRRSGEQFQEVRQRLAAAREAIEVALEEARQRGRRESQSLVADRDQQLAAADEKLQTVVSTKERWKETEISRAGQTFPQGLARLRETLEDSLAEIKQKHDAALARATETRDGRAADNEQQYQERCRVLRAEHDRAWETLRGRWFAGLAMLRDAWEGMNTECQRLFPDWDTTDYTTWPQPIEVPTAFRFGEVTLELANVKHGIPRDERLRPVETRILLPALMTLDEHPVLVVTAEEEGRRQAIEVLQLAMLRMLTAMPAGKVRFTILDPVGLGENFASFMHLADYDEQLIASRIWTDSKQIEDQLTRLTAHMETVLQKYLRNEFATIAEYNERAGEVAEPFQVLVVANFPANCSESAARKLVSIATSGPRCGVYTILSVDRKQRLPNDFELNDLLANAVHLDWQPREQRFRWRYPAFEHMTLLLDRPPSAERFNEVVRAAGRTAKDSMKVEVPFEVVAPAENEYWSQNSGRELIVPIGRAGAMRLQSIQLGRGTSQHVLICGKTGSGKSTLLHALITNTALHYSPDEVEFYLIDFKKGVEFKTYATHHLPHARVIAIESEREFGMSVLERLDAELHRRGDLFRAAGVQDVPDFRDARPNEPMPRVLLVVDEFQELFVEDDKLSQDAALLLDRLVRQGRAFGIHVLLGSQTL
ncbi:MAG: AAA family ATPase, partial [Planctomycetes bacterium]|nr:AAA family ATPase [Planctomycetota bacterium]